MGLLSHSKLQISQHADLFISQALLHPEIYDMFPFTPPKDKQEFLTEIVGRYGQGPSGVLFVVYDKTKSSALSGDESKQHQAGFAGIAALAHSSAANLTTEIGCMMILPAFQRTHVASNTVGLLLHYALDLPSFSSPEVLVTGPVKGLGLRRVTYGANHLNKASIRLAERMGFKMVGISRWSYILPASKTVSWNERDVRKGDPREECRGIDSVLLELCWDNWELDIRDRVDGIMARGRKEA